MLCPIPSVEELSSTLLRCCKSQTSTHVLRLYAYLGNLGLRAHTSLGNDLIFSLVEIGSLQLAQLIFDRLSSQDERSQNAIIMAYTKYGDPRHALSLHLSMSVHDSFCPNDKYFVSLLKACTTLNDLERGQELHFEIARRNLLERKSLIGSSLIQMYARCNSLGKSHDLFHELVERDVYSWNALIGAFVEQGHCEEALTFFHQMQGEGTTPDAVTLVCCLKACSALRTISTGFDLHFEIARKGYLDENHFVGSALVDMYAKCGALAEAKNVINKLPSRDTFTWTALLAGYAKHGHGEAALLCYKQMQHEGIIPSAVTFVCTLKACISVGAIVEGQELHAEISRVGLLGNSVHIGSALVDMYSKCGFIKIAQEVFDELQSHNEILWNTLIAGYIDQGLSAEAFYNYELMQLEGFSPDFVTYICSLKACINLGNVENGYDIHTEIVKRGLEVDIVVGTALVDMYIKTSCLKEAREVMDKMPSRNGVTWNALIAGYTEQGHDEDSLASYEQMHFDGVIPDAVTFICCAKVCGNLGATEKGQVFHSEIFKRGMDLDLVVGGALVDMYCRFGQFAEVKMVFDRLSSRDDVSWNALITGYLDAGHADKALEYFEQMQSEGVSQDALSLVSGLKACGNIGMRSKGQEMHMESVKKGLLERDAFLSSALIDMYAHCGSLTDAQAIIDNLRVQNVVSWNALMTGFVEEAQCEKVLDCYKRIQHEGMSPDAVTFVCTLKACGIIKALKEGQELHSHIAQRGLEGDIQLGSTLVDMYGKFSSLAEAEETFKKLPVRNVVSWNVLIANYLEHGDCDQALSFFGKMEYEGVSWDAATAVSCLKAWANIGSMEGARKMHCAILTKGLENAPLVGNTLIDGYVKVGLLSEAQDMFYKLPVTDRVSCNTLIAGTVDQGQLEEAFYLFQKMQTVGVCPDAITFTFILKACGCKPTIKQGRKVHAECVKRGLLEVDVFVDTALVDMYLSCNLLADAQKVFSKLPLRNLASWNAFLAGHVEQGLSEEALNLYDQMQSEGIAADSVTTTCVLKACGNIGSPVMGREIHAFITKIGLDREPVVGNALVDMYDKCDSISEAENMFDRLPVQDIVSWTTLIAGYAGHGKGEAALSCFEVMRKEGIPGSAVTFACSLKACGSNGALVKGQTLHSQIAKVGLESESHIGNTLVDMYSKCGLLGTMQEVFNKLLIPDVIAWNSLIAGCAQLGEIDLVFSAFNHMFGEDVMPDIVTFTSLLNACSNAGLVDEGNLCFQAIKNELGCMPILDHYTCMVDLLGRAGSLSTAVLCVERMPYQPGILLWHILLGACRKWGDAQLGLHAFEHAMGLDANAASAYVCLSNLYADVGISDKMQAMWTEKNIENDIYGTG